MEDFTPDKQYRPEDEYESLEPQAPETSAQPVAPQNIPTQPMYQAPQAGAYPNPPQQPYYAPYPQQPVQQPVQQPIPQQPIQQPVQQYPPVQNPAYPQNIPPQAIRPVYPQPPVPQQGQPVQNGQPYQQQQTQPNIPLSPNPYAQSYHPTAPQPAPQPQKPPTPTGTKVFIIILCALLVMMIVGFAVYIATGNNRSNSARSNSGFSDNDGNNGDYEISPFDIIGNYKNYTEVADEITLKADNGDTLKRDDDNEASVGEPDEKTKNITLEPLPKDKDDDKYDTHSAYNAVSDSVVTVVCYKDKITDSESDIVAQGTGTVISADGYIVTNAHVISSSRMYAINIVFNNNDEYPAKIVGYDTWTDLAVLKIDAKNLKAVTFGDSALVNVGDDVIAIGSPGGQKFENSLARGIVSAVDRELSINKYVRYIQSDAAISPGNSGGPLCNIYGQVIGITTIKTVANYYENMSFSIPSATVEEIVGDLMRYGYVKGRCRIGITGTETGNEYSDAPSGVIINAIDESGPLADTKIKAGDIITELDGTTITSFQDIYDVLANHKEGDKISIKVQRPSD